MRTLISIQDVRDNAKQIGKQINSESFAAYVRRIQKRQLTELLGQSLFYEFFNFLDNGFANYSGNWTRDSATQITIIGADLSNWTDYSLRLNNEVFAVVDSAVFGGADTILTVSGYDIPTAVTTIEFSAENKYIKLLNGTTYIYNNNTIFFDGLRGFLSYHFIASYIIDADIKQNDVGNIKILGDLHQTPSAAKLSIAQAEYLQNAIAESNNIKQYLNELYSDFPLWNVKKEENLNNYSWNVI